MHSIKEKNNTIIFIVFIVVFFVIIIIATIKILFTKPILKDDEKMTITENEVLPDRFIKNREYKGDQNKILVGKNVKEIENGYYDFKIEYYKDKIYLYINKPFKEIKKEVVDVDQVYMYEVLNFINNKYSLEIEEYIYEYVILLADKYKDFRSENTNNINLSAKINDNYSYLIDIHENMLRFCIKVE